MKNNYKVWESYHIARLKYCFLGCLIASGAGFLPALAHAQTARPVSSNVSPVSPAITSRIQSSPMPIPISEVATEAESALTRMRDLKADLSSDQTTEMVAQQLPVLTRDLDARLSESQKIAAQKPSIEMLGSLEADWLPLQRNVGDWAHYLTSRVSRLERAMAQLDELDKTWQQTLEVAKRSNTPLETVQRIEAVINAIKQTRDAISKERNRTLSLQNRITTQGDRIADALVSITNARQSILNNLLVKDSPAIWNRDLRARSTQNLEDESRSSLATQWVSLRDYAERRTTLFFVHVFAFGLLAAGFYGAQRQLRLQAETDPASVAPIFEMPITAALMVSLLCSRWIYPQAPRPLWIGLGALALIPSVVIIRKVIDRQLYPILYALVLFYFVDQVRNLTAAVPLLPRLLFLAEMLGSMLFVVWLVMYSDRSPRFTTKTERLRKTVKGASYIALTISGISLIANITGYVTLATLLGNALLRSAYLALILYAAVEVLDNIIMMALRLRPLALLSVVNRNWPLMRHRARRGLQWLAILLWILFTLDRLLLREPLFKTMRAILTAELTVGSLRLSLEDGLAFGVTVWAAFFVSRCIRFLLEEEVYPRINLRHGLPYAISTMLNYVILLFGFFAAIAALGLDMTKVTILAGAFSVGVGLGLQNIVSNFVAGLILLFERPINVGDMVQIDDASGFVQRIGIRASVIQTMDGSEIIVPNGKLISDRVINWTLSNRQHSIELPITVAQDSDPSRVIVLLERTAAAHPLVTDNPPPQALVVKLGPDSLGFELRAWTDRIEHWMQIRSELAISIGAALVTAKIAMR